MSEKESAEVYKQVHQDIKFKKKEAAKTSLDKEEFQRLAREIEKESVTSAVNENQKVNNFFLYSIHHLISLFVQDEGIIED